MAGAPISRKCGGGSATLKRIPLPTVGAAAAIHPRPHFPAGAPAVMKIHCPAIVCLVLLAPAPLFALTDADRESILADLEEIQHDAAIKRDGKYGVAIAAFRSAMGSDEAALALYLNCYGKLNFEDKDRKDQQFREWKRKQSDHLSNPAFQKALRLQLAWLVLTLQAAGEKPDRPKLAKDAAEIVAAIFRDADRFAPQQELLEQAVTASVFGKAYGIGQVRVANWSPAPGLLERFYEDVVLPPLRLAGPAAALRAAWLLRIDQETARNRSWNTGGGGKKKNAPGQQQSFATDELPKLKWEMEVDLFKHGDEDAAAVRMLAHIRANLTHPSAGRWSGELRQLLQPAAAPAVEETPTGFVPDP